VEPVDPLARPSVPESPADRARAWIAWFGLGRLVAGAVSTVVVCLGALWLVRSPPPATEASLPVATTSTTVSTAAPPIVPGVGVGDPAPPVLVHVTGAVHRPGLHELAVGSRVADAIAAAGGPTPDADPDALNLAAVVVDASRLHVPAVGEEVPPAWAPSTWVPPAEPAGPLDVNRATAEQLDELPGIGPATAAAIVTERETNGPFVGVDDLLRVPGIGPAKLEALRAAVTT
jgi:competence protein ComEA